MQQKVLIGRIRGQGGILANVESCVLGQPSLYLERPPAAYRSGVTHILCSENGIVRNAKDPGSWLGQTEPISAAARRSTHVCRFISMGDAESGEGNTPP